jgi:uncharacterized membrane protein YbhN (UPF0104 family)
MKKWLKVTLQALITLLAFYLVSRQISFEDLSNTFTQIEVPWIILAWILYNLSQVISSGRLLGFYRNIQIPLTFQTNLLIYYRAMFYGLFLPGGVSGDAYKVLILQKQYRIGYRELITATLSDRFNGLVVLLSIDLLLLFAGFGKLEGTYGRIQWIIPILLFTGWVVYILGMRWLAAIHVRKIGRSAILSFMVQVMQLAAFCCILYALDTLVEHWLYYGILFFAGGVLSALPISISGMGMREWAMVTSSGIFGTNPNIAFTASFCFFLITATSALAGGLITFRKQKIVGESHAQAAP